MLSQDSPSGQREHRDFFISYTDSDRQWAEWIAMQLETAGYTLFIQVWDFRPGSNFVAEMDHAATCAERTLLVLSPAYLLSDYTFAEWATAYHHDPKGMQRKVLPVQIEPCEVEGLLGLVVSIDLVALDEAQARERLLAGVQQGRMKPATVAFPGQSLPREVPSLVEFPGSLPTIWSIPYLRNPFFTGRDNLLEQLHTHLQGMHTAVLSQPQAVNGLGGIGKTQLVIEYAYRYSQEYQAVLWARAETTEALSTSYTEIAHLLKLPQRDTQEQNMIVQEVKNWLRTNQGWLLILDNADELNAVQPFLPTRFAGHLVLTTRTQILGKLAQRLEVDTLDTKMGALFLLRRGGLVPSDAPLERASPSDRAIACALSEELGGLPLALDQAGAYIEETECSLVDYQQQYRRRRAELLARRGMLVDEHPEPVSTTWSLSFAKVEAANPIAGELLRICAFLDPDVILEALLVEALKTPLPASGRQPIPAHLTTSQKDIHKAIAILRSYSLLQRNTRGGIIRIHRLVQAVVRDGLKKHEQEAWTSRVVHAFNTLYPVNRFESWEHYYLFRTAIRGKSWR